jgi:DNA-binding beta-propeller fold protein YncE
MKTYSAIIRSLALIINVFALTVGVSPHARAAGKQLLVGNAADNSVSSYDGTTGVFLQIFVPSGSGGLDTPQDLTIGPDGNLYVSSFNTSSVERYNGRTGASMGTFAAGGGLDGPEQLVFGPDSNLYVSSFNSNSVLRYSGTKGGFQRAFVTAGSGGLNAPTGLAFGRDGNLYVSSNASDEVLRYDGDTGAFKNIVVPAGRQQFPAFLTFAP